MSRRRRSGPALWRFFLVLALLSIGTSGLLARAIELQVLQKQFYQHQGQIRHVREVDVPAHRGALLDRRGEPLAISTPVESIWALPERVLASEDLALLASVLEMRPEQLQRRLIKRRDKDFLYLRRHVAPAVAEQVRALHIPGVQFLTEYRRYYPAGEVTAQLLGFTDIDDNGLEGMELAFDGSLVGSPGRKRVIRDNAGRVVEEVELLAPARPGGDVVLSIDRRLQYQAYRELKAAMQMHGASAASAVVLDAKTFEVLAMVNLPAFNPNDRTDLEAKRTRNRAVTDLFEPGSIIKPFAIAAALESGRFAIDSEIDTAPGQLTLAGYTIKDHRDYGVLDITGILTKSSNVGASKMALALDREHIFDAYSRFGFGRVTGSGFPGESAGVLNALPRWRQVDQAAASYGYGLSVTVLQVAQAYAVIANDGRLRAPSFVKGVVNPAAAVIDPRLARTLATMLETVTGSEGTGKRANVAHYRVAGKTGTARKAADGGYADDRYVSSFAGFAPASNPSVVPVVVIDEPRGEHYYGGEVAAPAFSNIMAAALRLRNAPPDDLLRPASTQLAAGAP